MSRSQILDVETGEQTFKDVEFTLIELPKFKKKANKLQSLFEKWVFFIKNAENLTFIPDDVDDEGLKSAYEGANQHTWSQTELDEYDSIYIREEDTRATLDKAVSKAKEEGMTEGKIEIAKKAISKGFDNDDIAELTGLAIKEIEALRKK
jgi:predicted transposase/invertase (TIGR01784 family)